MTPGLSSASAYSLVKTDVITSYSIHYTKLYEEGEYFVSDVLEITKRAYPFRDVTKQDIEAVLEMLAGDYEHDKNIPVRPRLLYDRIHESVEGDNYSRMLAVSAGGTIPDKGLFAVKTDVITSYSIHYTKLYELVIYTVQKKITKKHW